MLNDIQNQRGSRNHQLFELRRGLTERADICKLFFNEDYNN